MSEFRAALKALVDASSNSPMYANCPECVFITLGPTRLCAYHAAKALLARPEPEPRITREWQPISTAPKDGRLVFLLVYIAHSKHPTEQEVAFRSIGHNNLDNDGEDSWQFAGWCWEHDHFTQATGEPISWMPLPSLPSTPAASDGEKA